MIDLQAILNSPMSAPEKLCLIENELTQQSQNMEAVYTKIGKLYVSLHGANYESDFAGMFEAIRETENTIRECRAAIREVQGVVCCEKCGTDVPKTSAFCAVCGAPMPGHVAPAVEEDMVRCTVCGKMMKKDMRFCTSCGMPMLKIAQQEEAPVAPVEDIVPPVEEIVAPVEEIVAPVEEIVAPVEEIVAPVEEAPVCANCGKPYHPGALFCTGCGQKTQAPAPVQPEPEVPEAPTCPNCGKVLREGMLFCTGCGQKLDAAPAVEEAPSKKFCTVCGKENAPNARFCTSCGTTL